MTADSSRDKLDELAADFEAGFDLPAVPTAPSTPAPAAGTANSTSPGTELRGLLSRRTPRPPHDTPSPTTAPLADSAAVVAPLTPPRPDTPPAQAPASSQDSTGGLRPTTFSVPTAVIDRLAAFKADNVGVTTADVVLDALEATEAQLSAALGPAPPEGRFARAPQRARRTPEVGRLGQLHVRLVASNFAILDDLVTKSGATSRSHLVTTALTIYLNQHAG